jgi:hypothetical protein
MMTYYFKYRRCKQKLKQEIKFVTWVVDHKTFLLLSKKEEVL